MRNTLSDLNNILFEQLERLQDDTLDVDALQKEIARSKAVSDIANRIVENAQLALDAQKHFDEYGADRKIELPLLTEK